MFWFGPGMGGWGPGWGLASMVINGAFLAVLLAGAAYLLLRGPAAGPRPPTDAHHLLAERYARGEIDDEEYRRKLATLDRP